LSTYTPAKVPRLNGMRAFRIAVVRLGAMGDVIHALPAVASLKHSFPHSHVSWVIRPRWMPLLEGNPFLDEVIPLDRNMSSIAKTWRWLRQEKFDLAVDFQGLVQSALVAAAARPDRIIGFHRSQAWERWASLFYSTGVMTSAPHIVDRNLELVAAAGASSLLRTFPLPHGAPEGDLPAEKFVLASPLAGWRSKQWPLESYAQVARELDLPLVLNGPPEAKETLSRIRGVHVHISGLPGLIDATRRAHAVIGVDSGPMHLAAALGKPGIAIFGPTDPARNGPYGGSLRVLRCADAVTTYKRRDNDEAMRLVPPTSVAQALSAILESKSAGCPA
jgi:heptosyltransferase-1